MIRKTVVKMMAGNYIGNDGADDDDDDDDDDMIDTGPLRR